MRVIFWIVQGMCQWVVGWFTPKCKACGRARDEHFGPSLTCEPPPPPMRNARVLHTNVRGRFVLNGQEVARFHRGTIAEDRVEFDLLSDHYGRVTKLDEERRKRVVVDVAQE